MPAEVTPAVMGMAVIIILQLSQFYFAWRKDMRGEQSVRKEDLSALRNQIMNEIEELGGDVKDLRVSLDKRTEIQNQSAHSCRNEMHNRITHIALQTAALVEGMETTKQTLAAMGMKLDTLRLTSHTRKLP